MPSLTNVDIIKPNSDLSFEDIGFIEGNFSALSDEKTLFTTASVNSGK